MKHGKARQFILRDLKGRVGAADMIVDVELTMGAGGPGVLHYLGDYRVQLGRTGYRFQMGGSLTGKLSSDPAAVQVVRLLARPSMQVIPWAPGVFNVTLAADTLFLAPVGGLKDVVRVEAVGQKDKKVAGKTEARIATRPFLGLRVEDQPSAQFKLDGLKPGEGGYLIRSSIDLGDLFGLVTNQTPYWVNVPGK